MMVASTRGPSVRATSSARRSAIQRITKIAPSENRPASMKARTTVRPDSTMMMGVPVAFGATVRTAAAKRSITALSLESPFGNASIRARPAAAGREPLAHEVGRQRVARYRRVDGQSDPQLVEKTREVDRDGGLRG